jgi:predicted  nucleic acid-binding Zn-ribbon protein
MKLDVNELSRLAESASDELDRAESYRSDAADNLSNLEDYIDSAKSSVDSLKQMISDAEEEDDLPEIDAESIDKLITLLKALRAKAAKQAA